MNVRPFPLLTVLLAATLVGCASEPSRDPDFAVVRPSAAPAAWATPGSLYQSGHELVLFEDTRARRVGDILTILLVEQIKADSKAKTSIDKEMDTTIPNPTLFGSTPQFNLPNAFPLASTTNNTLETRFEADHEFDGDAKSEQSNSLRGEISVTVAEVLPNGSLVVQGEKLLTLNQGREHVRFSGIVRAEDITPENTVASTRVANARIIYAGEGAMADANTMGWLARFFISAVFPF